MRQFVWRSVILLTAITAAYLTFTPQGARLLERAGIGAAGD
ncbi:hypothetical protein [Aliiroseovarius subalbicans]|nr:hypothetical protein [Aliiroseovarius subalbicans]